MVDNRCRDCDHQEKDGGYEEEGDAESDREHVRLAILSKRAVERAAYPWTALPPAPIFAAVRCSATL